MDLSKREPLQVEYVSADSIKPYKKNAKTHDKEQVKKIASSIKRFGWRKPIVVDKDGVIVCGHGAFFAAKSLGLEKIPVAYARDLTDKEIKAYRLADNKVAESPWDFKLLNEELLEIGDYEMDGFGFEIELDLDEPEPEQPHEEGQQPQEPTFRDANGDPIQDEGYREFQQPLDNDILKQYEENAETFLVKRRIIITYADEEEGIIRGLLGIPDDKPMKVVYDLSELTGAK